MDDELEVLQRLVAAPQIFADLEKVSGSALQRQAALREKYDPAMVRAALLLAELRQKASDKFTLAHQLWFDRVGLEQSTAELVARHKAQRFQQQNEPVFDLCCGIGSDSIAIAGTGNRVVGVDLSLMSCERARLNARVYGVEDRFQTQVADVTSIPLSPSSLIHIDPDRRAGRQRAIKLEDYAPPLEFLQGLMERTAGGAFKLSPASNFGGKFGSSEIELISLNGECKEATVWYGQLSGPVAMRATILPSGESFAGNPWEWRPKVGPLARYLYDPDPAVVRAGLLDLVTHQLGLHRLDDAEEYLSSDQLIPSSAVTPFEVLANLPNNETEIRKWVRLGNFGEIEIKSRHVPTNADAMRKKMSLNGQGRVTLVIARIHGKTRALMCRRVTSTNPG